MSVTSIAADLAVDLAVAAGEGTASDSGGTHRSGSGSGADYCLAWVDSAIHLGSATVVWATVGSGWVALDWVGTG